MTTTDQQIRAAITQRAADWFTANRAGPLGGDERAAFFAWLKASPIHVEEYLGVAALERGLTAATDDPAMTLDALLELARQDRSGQVVDLITATEVESHRGRRSQRRVAWSIAAVIALAVGALWMQSTMRDGQWLGLPKTYQTAHGAQGEWRLPDGSVLHLNTDSTVTVRYSSTERLLALDRGEAMFEVAHETRRAFRVLAGSINAVAAGTQFDAYRRADSTQITVIAGQIAVFDGKAAPADAAAASPSVLRVSAGQQVRVTAGVLPAAPTNVNLGRSWPGCSERSSSINVRWERWRRSSIGTTKFSSASTMPSCAACASAECSMPPIRSRSRRILRPWRVCACKDWRAAFK